MFGITKIKLVFCIESNANFSHFSLIVKIGVASTVPIRSMSTSTISSAITSETAAEDQVQRVNLLRSTDDNYDGVIVELDQPMDSTTFISILRASVSHWKKLVGNLSN